jgi:hypothetical protein
MLASFFEGLIACYCVILVNLFSYLRVHDPCVETRACPCKQDLLKRVFPGCYLLREKPAGLEVMGSVICSLGLVEGV